MVYFQIQNFLYTDYRTNLQRRHLIRRFSLQKQIQTQILHHRHPLMLWC
jgi:hypothetical protein